MGGGLDWSGVESLNAVNIMIQNTVFLHMSSKTGLNFMYTLFRTQCLRFYDKWFASLVKTQT